MKRIFLLLFAIISFGLFLYSAIHLKQQFSNSEQPQLGEVQGFEAINPTDAYNQLVKRFQTTIQTAQTKADHDQTWYFWMSFVVTTLTAGSTLVSSIQAAKPAPAVAEDRTKTLAILIAVLTFCSTLSSFASNHFNELKTEHAKTVTDLTAKLNQFYADYDKAAAADKPNVITTYARQLP